MAETEAVRSPDGSSSNGGGEPTRERPTHSDDDQYLLDGEEVLVDARPAWTAWFPQLLVAGVILLGGLVTSEPAAIALAVVVSLAVVGYVAYQRRRVHYLVTDRRILIATGISSKATNEAWMRDIRGMQTGASLLERLLGHGHIAVSTSIMSRGSLLSFAGLQGMTLGGIADYQDIARVIRRRQAEAKRDR